MIKFFKQWRTNLWITESKNFNQFIFSVPTYIFKVEKSKDDLVFEPFLVPFSIVLL